MNDVLINTFGEIFHLKPTELSYIQLSFFGSFFLISLLYFVVSSVSGSDPINKIGYKNGMAISLLICGLGCSGFYLAATNTSYPQFILALFVLAAGVTFLQICANPFATILGSEESASSRLNLAQGFNSLGTTLGPTVGLLMIYSLFANYSTLQGVGLTYLFYGLIFILAALMVKFSNLPSFENLGKQEKGESIFKNRNLNFGILAIFFYVGSEVAVGSWIGAFGKRNEIMGLNAVNANAFLAFFWGGLMIGRLMASISLNEKYSSKSKLLKMALTSLVIFGLIWLIKGIDVNEAEGGKLSFNPVPFGQIWIYGLFLVINYFAFIAGKGKAQNLVVIFAFINIVLLAIGILAKGPLAFWSILGTGLFFSIGWSNIFSLSIKGLGANTSRGSSLLVMAIVGGACLPWIQSHIIEAYSVQTSFIVPLIGMIYLIFYGLNGYKRNAANIE